MLLHNFLRRNETAASIYTPPGTIDVCDNTGVIIQPGSWRREIGENCAIRPIDQVPRRSPENAIQIREQFTSYFYNNN